MRDSQPIIIGAIGESRSGEAGVSRAIFGNFPNHLTMILEQGSYYKGQSHLSFKERSNTDYDHPFALDADLLIQHVEQLLSHQAIERSAYGYVAHTRNTETVTQKPKEVTIFEGILILEDRRLRDLMDTKVYVDTSDDIRVIRRIKRDVEGRDRTLDFVIEQHLATVKPMYHRFIEPTKRCASIIVPEGGESHVAVDLINTKVDSILTEM